MMEISDKCIRKKISNSYSDQCVGNVSPGSRARKPEHPVRVKQEDELYESEPESDDRGETRMLGLHPTPSLL